MAPPREPTSTNSGKARFTTVSGEAGAAALHAGRSARRLELRAISGLSGPAALYARNSCHRLPRQTLDHASVLRLCLSGRDERALQVPAGAWRRRPFRGLRPAHADGLRQRSSVQRGRGRQMRRRHRFAGGHGDPVQRNRSGKHDGLDDHQLAGFDPVGHVPGGGRKTGRRLEEAFGHHPERHPEGIHRAEGVHLSARAFHAAGDRYLRVRIEVHAPLQHHFHQRLSHPRGRLDGAARAGLHHLRRRGVRRMGPAARA